ncbi:MAG: tRNA 2-thiouridine(34) synthase MnmA [Candidatus Ancillula trichonymphae]|nr:tRNA 2-thiouridine(34) synthase MnmA [Candidatus Ancillula trichonymphae]
MRVLVGMSGGVDSSLAAALAREAGHEVMGVTMQLTRKEQLNLPGFIDHGSFKEAHDAELVAQKIGIRFECWDMSEVYKERVIMHFIREYARGSTPNPCVACNENVKFAALVAKARGLGFDKICTGHYARVVNTELHRAVDLQKDQSYFVASMPPEVVKYCYFPLGEFANKKLVRAEAKKRGFATHNKKDSADICFLEKKAKRAFLQASIGDNYRGNIVDLDGNILGEHAGFWNFTVGQRQGLDLKTPAKDGHARFVISTNPKTHEVVVGSKEALLRREILLEDIRIFDASLLDNSARNSTRTVELRGQIRAHGEALLGVLELQNNKAKFRASGTTAFEAVTRGQSFVGYDAQSNLRVLLKATIQGS